MRPGKIIYVDDGVLSFEVTEVHEVELKAVALNSGVYSSKKGVNLPNTDVDLPPLSEKDIADIKFGVENGIHMIFASFIRSGSDVIAIREALGQAGKGIKVISKIENQQGLNNFDEILKESDGIMVARGDLGIEIPASQVFVAQKSIIARCNLAGKPAIWYPSMLTSVSTNFFSATQMLESMTLNPRPTRAEISDVGNAVLDGADCIMLSGETAKGAYPVEAVSMMHETALLAETAIFYPALYNELRSLHTIPTHTTETICCAAVSASIEQDAKAIIVLTTTYPYPIFLTKMPTN